MTFDSWSAIDSGDSVIRNRKITTVVLGAEHGLFLHQYFAFFGSIDRSPPQCRLDGVSAEVTATCTATAPAMTPTASAKLSAGPDWRNAASLDMAPGNSPGLVL
jgi:hypothetical protein